MPECQTLGSAGKAVNFTYTGCVNQGVEIKYKNSTVNVSNEFFANILNHFRGVRVAGGFKVDDPTPNGFGEWVRDNSNQNSQALTPKHASRIAAILVCERFATRELDGNTVYLNFNA